MRLWVLGVRELEVGRFFRIMVFVFASFWVDLAKLLCTLVHEIPDQVRDDGGADPSTGSG